MTYRQRLQKLNQRSLSRSQNMVSEVTPEESKRAGEWEREAVQRAERLAAVDRHWRIWAAGIEQKEE